MEEDYVDFGFGDTELDTYGSGSSGEDYGLGDAEVTAIISAKDRAAKSGQSQLLNILDYVFKYGSQAADILVKTGVIRNRNVASLSAGDINQAALDALLKANGGSLPPTRSASVTTTGSFSISQFFKDNMVPISILTVLGVGVYVLTSKPQTSKKR